MSFWLSFRTSLLLRDPLAMGPVEETKGKSLRGRGVWRGLDASAQACSPPRAVAPVPQQNREPGDASAFGSHLTTPRVTGRESRAWGNPPTPTHAGIQGTRASRKEAKPAPETKLARNPTHQRPAHHAACLQRHFPTCLSRCLGKVLMGPLPKFPPSQCQWRGTWLLGAKRSPGHICRH